jgi:predicted ribosomally synthesized peptide with nif11-like leader
MSEEQLNAFMEAVEADERLQEKLKVAEDADAVVAIAKEAGFAISMEVAQKIEEQLSDDDLENVTGGMGRGARGTHVNVCKDYAKFRAQGWDGEEDLTKWRQNTKYGDAS